MLLNISITLPFLYLKTCHRRTIIHWVIIYSFDNKIYLCSIIFKSNYYIYNPTKNFITTVTFQQHVNITPHANTRPHNWLSKSYPHLTGHFEQVAKPQKRGELPINKLGRRERNIQEESLSESTQWATLVYNGPSWSILVVGVHRPYVRTCIVPLMKFETTFAILTYSQNTVWWPLKCSATT